MISSRQQAATLSAACSATGQFYIFRFSFIPYISLNGRVDENNVVLIYEDDKDGYMAGIG
jgi:hypothetical protein